MRSPITRYLAKSDDPKTWASLDKACAYAEQYGMDGAAFALTDGIVFVDIDDIADKPKELQDKITELCLSLDTYCESSVSGKGLHFLCKGHLPKQARKRNDRYGVEMYETKRFVCMTGNIVGARQPLNDLSEQIIELNRRYVGEPYKETKIERRSATASDTELINAICKSKNGAKFERLYSGDWSGYESQSSADFALLRILTFWTQDATQLDSIFRSSGLYRPKWDKSNGYYGRYQIENALRLTTATRRRDIEM